ncbi:hypothetical protein caldi_24870 [Caldinitratiruptor microaerophilus]|uniref:Uncharacterized protein n=1 Tax=Caldinitratiruptor microaerophilus TaxID=671077 RepID=A0AA35CLG9_9FIRM|nr:hypothetical protein caldi_24870 [Caldinitratiruptor microaerophilus]
MTGSLMRTHLRQSGSVAGPGGSIQRFPREGKSVEADGSTRVRNRSFCKSPACAQPEAVHGKSQARPK